MARGTKVARVPGDNNPAWMNGSFRGVNCAGCGVSLSTVADARFQWANGTGALAPVSGDFGTAVGGTALVTVWMLFDLVVTLGDVRSFSPDTHATAPAPAHAQGVQTRTCCTV